MGTAKMRARFFTKDNSRRMLLQDPLALCDKFQFAVRWSVSKPATLDSFCVLTVQIDSGRNEFASLLFHLAPQPAGFKHNSNDVSDTSQVSQVVETPSLNGTRLLSALQGKV